MKLGLKRKDVVLLLSLLLIIIGLLYYFYVYIDKSADLDSKRTELENLKVQTENTRQTIATEGLLDTRLLELEKNIKEFSEKYYGDIKQENEIVNIGTLYETSAIDIQSMNFTHEVSKLSELANAALEMIEHNTNPLGEAAQEPATSTDSETPAEPEAPADSTAPEGDAGNGETSETKEGTESDTKETESSDKNTAVEKTAGTPSNPNFEKAIEKDTLAKTAQVEDNSMDQDVVTLTTAINYKGTFEDLERFLRNIYSNKKYIVLKDVTITSNGEGELSGNLSIAMHGLPAIAALFGPDNHIYYEGVTRRASQADVYLPYDTFKKPQVSAPAFPEGTTPEVEKDPFGVEKGEVAKTLYGFEGADYFFVPGNDTTNGSITRVAKRKQGLYGALLNYDFMEFAPDNEANLVFDKNPIIVNEIADRIEFFVYTRGEFRNELYLVLVDQFSQEHMLKMEIKYVNETKEDEKNKGAKDGWGIASAKFPLSMTSPFAIERIVVKGGEDAHDLSGSIVFDNLRMVTKGDSDDISIE